MRYEDDDDEPYLVGKTGIDGKYHLMAQSKRDPLPDGVEHGSAKAARLGCTCSKCSDRRARMKRHGWRI